MKFRFGRWIAVFTMVTLFGSLAPQLALGSTTATVSVSSTPIPESADFASLVLRDPWDMSEFTDISQYLNNSGQRDIIRDVQVSDGMFSARSVNNAITGDGNAYFFVLWPGYRTYDELAQPTTMHGKVGTRYPISTAEYNCLYVALKTDSPAANNLGPDVLRVWWFLDGLTNDPQANPPRPYGYTYLQMYPDAPGGGAGQPTPSYRLYKVDLNSRPGGTESFAAWNSQSVWRGLRIDPTAIAGDIPFTVDWVRLTNCAENNTTITFTPDGSVDSVWIQPVGTTRDIRVATGISGFSGSATFDTSGIAPGSYIVKVGNQTTCCTQESSAPLVINQLPIPTFAMPSFTSGADYATAAGNPWDFSDEADATVTYDPNTGGAPPGASYANGFLTVNTPPGPLPAGIDVQLKLNDFTRDVPNSTAQTGPVADTSQYRYLTVRETFSGSPQQNWPEGMHGRFIWSVQGTNNLSGFRCTIVGGDVVFDVGLNQMSLDLFDPVYGSRVAEKQGLCDDSWVNWQSTPPALELRYDPNENVSEVRNPLTPGFNFIEQYDWIRLTKEDTVVSGQAFRVAIGLNKGVDSVPTRTIYYTTDRNNPTQNPAVEFIPPAPTANTTVFLSYALGGGPTHLDPVPNMFEFAWDTTGVAPGRYYICVELNDGLNGNTQCSEAPVLVK